MKTQYIDIWVEVLYADGFQEYIQYGKHFRGKHWHAYNNLLKQIIRALPDSATYAVNSVSFS